MALEQIFAKISEDAKSEAHNILDIACREVDKILADAHKEAALLENKIITSARAEEEFNLRKENISQRLSAQKEILQVKKTGLANCFQQALEILLNLDDDLYRTLIKKMLLKINFKAEAKIVFSRCDQRRISQEYIHKLNPQLKLSFCDDIQGGFLLKTEELIIDHSLANILASLQQDFEPKLAQILFKES
jgi:V/A-type H+-transporting ATPase subunit E